MVFGVRILGRGLQLGVLYLMLLSSRRRKLYSKVNGSSALMVEALVVLNALRVCVGHSQRSTLGSRRSRIVQVLCEHFVVLSRLRLC